jgi:hypothetical protein
MALPVISLVERSRLLAARPSRDANVTSRPARCLTDGLTVIPLVSHDSHPAQSGNEVRADLRIADLYGGEHRLHQPAFAIDHRVQLAVGSTSGLSDSLGFLASEATIGILMDLEVTRVDEPQRALLVAGQGLNRPVPNSFVAPQAPPGIDRLPRSENIRQGPPGATASQHVDHGGHQHSVAGWRPSTMGCTVHPQGNSGLC